MKLLFTIDKKNYPENAPVFRRPSVRGIILRGGKVAMMHSLKYGYYKLPGGGVEQGETLQQTLIREVAEESGLQVIPESIREFGYVERIEKGWDENIFVQENYYFFCHAEDALLPQQLDDYEAEEQFTLAFISPQEAIAANEQAISHLPETMPRYVTMLERENKILAMVQKQL